MLRPKVAEAAAKKKGAENDWKEAVNALTRTTNGPMVATDKTIIGVACFTDTQHTPEQ